MASVENEKIHLGAEEATAEQPLEWTLHEADMPFPEGQKQLWGEGKRRIFIRFHFTQ